MRNGSTQKSSASLATNVNEEEEKEVNQQGPNFKCRNRDTSKDYPSDQK